MEHAERVGDSLQLHYIVQLLYGRVKKSSPNLTSDGNEGDLRSEPQRLARWCDFCTRKFKAVDGPQTTRLITEALSQQEAAGMSNEISGEIQKEEVVEAISNLRGYNAPGCDQVKLELIQSSPEAIEETCQLCKQLPDKTDCAERSYVCIRKTKLTPPPTTE